MRCDPYRPADLLDIDLQAAHAYARSLVDIDYATRLGAGERAATLRVDGVIVASFGIVDAANLGGRLLWCFLAEQSKRHLLAIHRFALDFIRGHASPFLLATVEADFRAGERWLRMLGFEFVDMLEGYGPDGRDHVLFCRRGELS